MLQQLRVCGRMGLGAGYTQRYRRAARGYMEIFPIDYI